MPTSADFGELRSLLAKPPSARAFAQLCGLVGDGGLSQEVLTYLQSSLSRWPDDLRRAVPERWITPLLQSTPPPGVVLCTSLTIEEEEHGIHWHNIDALTGAPELTNLRHLHLARHRMGQHLITHLVDAPALAKIDHLELVDQEVGELGVLSILTSPHLGNMRHLNLQGNDLTSSDLEDLQDLSLRTLDTWTLSTNELGDEGAALLAKTPSMAQLHALQLDENELEDPGVRALAASSHLSGLTHLNLSNNFNLTPDAIASVARSQHLTRLQHLGLGDINLEGAASLLLGRSDDHHPWRTLRLSGCGLLPKDLAMLCTTPTLQDLDLSFNRLTPAHIEVLTTSPALSGLRTLDLSHNRLSGADLDRLAGAPNLEGLRVLRICGNDLTAEDVRVFETPAWRDRLQEFSWEGDRFGWRSLLR